MDEVVKVEIPVEPETARALGDSRRKQAIGRLVDRMVRPARGDDPLVAVLEATRRAARERDTLALSSAVYDEIREVLGTPKFAAALPLDRQREILERLSAAAIWAEPDISVTDCPDPGDNKYLERAVASGALIIVSGDRHLLNMHPWRGMKILRPAEYLALP